MTTLDPLAVVVTIASWSVTALRRGRCAMRRSPAVAPVRSSKDPATSPDRM